LAKAQAQTRSLASAAAVYAAHMEVLPVSLSSLTQAVSNPQGQFAGPFMASIPKPPTNWTPLGSYFYTANTAAGTFQISAAGDGTSAVVPERFSLASPTGKGAPLPVGALLFLHPAHHTLLLMGWPI